MSTSAQRLTSSRTMLPPAVLRPGTHIFTVDVEEYFHAHALAPAAPMARWHGFESRVADSTERLLDLLARHEAHGTFFVLGWVADRHPALVRRIVAHGHEVASHGYWHGRVAPMQVNQFRDELRRSRDVLEQLTGHRVAGFRAPSFSIVPGAEWAFDIMLEEGITYDSSLFPILRPGAGYPRCCPAPHFLVRPAGRLLELPLTTTVIGGVRLPAAGGAWLRHLPIGLVQRAFSECAERNVPGVFYMHPWEIDADQPVLAGISRVSRLRHYGGIHRMLGRVDQLLSQFRFTSVERAVGAEQLIAAA